MGSPFLGYYPYKVDGKGRVAIPARFRGQFQEGLVLARGFERCIVVYPIPEWERISQGLASSPIARSKSRRLNRIIFTSAFSFELDRQGRVALPAALRQHAQIEDEVIIAGAGSYLEIWSQKLWASEEGLIGEQAWQIAEGMEPHS